MKKSLMLLVVTAGVAFMSCGNASDGDAATDTTNFPKDVYGDTTNTINTNTGTYPADTMTQSPGQGSSPTSTDSRSTTPGQKNRDSLQ